MAEAILNVVAVPPTNLSTSSVENAIECHQREDLSSQIAQPESLPVNPSFGGPCAVQ
jgi:hypothetical protein